jgi:hypothetical protein
MFNPKQVQERVDEIRAALKQLTDTYTGPPNALLQVMGHVGELQVVLSERAEISADKMEKHTITLVRLTRGLYVFTAALIFLTLTQIVIAICK